MKIYIIKASSGSSFSKYKAQTGGPPQGIFSIAAATPKNIEIEMSDETINMKTNFNSDADIIVISMSTPDAYRAYEIAKKFKKKGKTIVLGGLHTKFMQEEAFKYADSLLIGDPEEIWEELLIDFNKGQLKEKYEREMPFDLANKKPYPTNIIHPSKYNYTWSVVVSRGCPNNCEFCLVPKFFKKYQLRPIENIINELKELEKLKIEWVELHADNLTANREYAINLFKAIEKANLNLNLFGETTVLIAKDKEMLEAAKNANIKALLFGIETPSEQALKDQNKGFVKPKEIKEYVKIVQDYGIEVWGDFLFGFDAEEKTIFKEAIDFIYDIKVDKVFPHLIIPFPGSDTFKRLNQEGRILTKDWSKYDGTHVVFEPTNMTSKELENGVYKVYETFKNNPQNPEKKRERKKGNFKWKTIIALTFLIIALLLNLGNFVFGLIFLSWSIHGMKSKQVYFIENIYKNKNPIIYWIITILWIILSVMMLFMDTM